MPFAVGLPRERRLGWLAIGAGMGLAVAIQLAAPVRVPLYDGVVVQEPYRYLHPTGNHAGSPTSYDADVQVVGESSPAFAAATTEQPPQAQLIAQQGAFNLATGTISLHLSITPVEAPPPPPGGTIAGNVYEISVTDQAGAPLSIAPCDGCMTLSMRAPEGFDNATLERYDNGTWTAFETLPVGVVSMFQANVTALGDIALIAQGAAPGPGGSTSGIDPVVFFGVGAVALWLLVFAFIAWRRLRPDPIPAAASRGRTIPSKQRPPKRPGSGRPQT